MSADHDGDSQMLSSGEDSDLEVSRNQTPADQVTRSSILSPPDSQHRAMPTSNSGSALANANGKRPINTISNGTDDLDDPAAMQQQQPAMRQEFPKKTHAKSGYSWSRAEDEPGHAWMNKKALDEMHRAWDALTHRDYMVKGKSMRVPKCAQECRA